jgi:uncharacterized protein YbaA (DUF1428 family)
VEEATMAYVDGFLLAVPARKLAAYRRIAVTAGKVWKDHGALEYRECVGDHLVQKGAGAFQKRARAKKGEVVIFSWVVYKSRAHRDKILPKVMQDKRLTSMNPKDVPFDMKRMSYGGFKVLVDM